MLAQSVKIFICNKTAVLKSFASSHFRNAKVFMPGKKTKRPYPGSKDVTLELSLVLSAVPKAYFFSREDAFECMSQILAVSSSHRHTCNSHVCPGDQD